MKYHYDKDLEAYVREDGLGKKLWINSVESQRIMTLYNLGNSISEIRNKITFNSKKVSESTIQNFINNVEKGDITIPTDAPVPVNESLTIEERMNRLEQDWVEFQKKYIEISKDNKSWSDKLRGKIGL